MLSRTADSLYWTGRYIERADFLARILEATLRLAAIPTRGDGDAGTVWASALASAGAPRALGRSPTEKSVREYLAFAPDNASSITACITRARTNARSVRTALTVELWEAINGAWNGLEEQGQPTRRDEFARFLEWVKTVTLSVEGATSRTMLRNDAYWFSRMGAAIERAANSARPLVVKYHLLPPAGARVGGLLSHFPLSTLLLAVPPLTAHASCHPRSVKPWLVAATSVLTDASWVEVTTLVLHPTTGTASAIRIPRNNRRSSSASLFMSAPPCVVSRWGTVGSTRPRRRRRGARSAASSRG